MRRGAHVSDERLIEVCVDGIPTPSEDVHFARCEACAGRRSQLEQLLRETVDATASEADAAFPDERLAAQRARILHRIEQEGRPARVIAFPATALSDARPLRARPAARWIAGAAAAGLAIGLLAGQLVQDLPTLVRPARPTVASSAASPPASQPAVRVVSASLNDEEFLGEIETAVSGPRLIALRPLNDLTPQ